ncbi:hypothetical protein [Chryseobacterium sp. YIM B08800]|uniref:hypothetical protein n=1 Tax=Chryseobacterium sp. YIM B08800 TaxID=2984136 RepID=UPI00223FEA6B|nr:hypothetical protein [Chryseobacterium sp. YIM B08800]
MKLIYLFVFILISQKAISQQMVITTKDNSKINIKIIDSSKIANLVSSFSGKIDSLKFKNWTSKTYTLNNNEIIIEFFDRQGALINNENDFNKIKDVRFVKNQIWNLRKNISYKTELLYEKGLRILQTQKPKRLTQFDEIYGLKKDGVYELKNGQILFLNDYGTKKYAGIYPDLKTLSSDEVNISEIYYNVDNEEDLMKKLANGDAMLDYEPNEHHIYPNYIDDLIKNHQLKFLEDKVYIKDFYANLYKSDKNGYYFLIDEVNQKNGAGSKMKIVEVNIFENLSELRNAQAEYEKFKNNPNISEYFYQKISDQYGKNFIKNILDLIDKLSIVLNIEKEKLTFDYNGLETVDEAIIWNHDNTQLFKSWFPSVLAFYGEYYIKNVKESQWVVELDEESKLWIPNIKLSNGDFAWDAGQLYKGLFEGSVKLQWLEEWKRPNQ